MAKQYLRALAAATLMVFGITTAQAAVEALPSTAASDSVTLWSELNATPLPAVLPNEVWVNIDLGSRKMAVYRGDTRVLLIPYLAIGNAGAQRIRLEGSSQTPIGEFHVSRVNRQSDFKLFFGIDYPTPDIAREAWRDGLMTTRDYTYYRNYLRQHGTPPGDTALGGSIGIHGLGARSARLHSRMDWTEGCIAITNAEIEALDRWVNIGTRVVIHGPGNRSAQKLSPQASR